MLTTLTSRKRKLDVSLVQPSRLNDLPNYLLAEIFRRLPLTTANRSKLVCKRWNSIISEPYFAEWFSHTKNPYSLFTVCGFGEKEQAIYSDSEFGDSALAKGLSLGFMKSAMSHRGWNIFVGTSSNDLLLCEDYLTYLVCNPVTREWVRIRGSSLSMYSAVGFTSKTNGEFAILMLLPGFHIKVLYSSTLIWAETNITYPPRARMMHMEFSSRYGLSCKDLLFWLDDTSGTVIGIDAFNILSKKKKNSLLFIEPPKGFVRRDIQQVERRYHKNSSYLGMCRGNLRLCQLTVNDLILRVWDLDDTEWLLYSEVSLQKMGNVSRIFTPERFWKIECFDPNDPKIIHITSDFIPREVASLNLLTGEIKIVLPCPAGEKLWRLIPYKLQWQPTRLLISKNRMLASCFF